ncbi:MAG: hypothetical protein AAFY88_07735 [Acidobacteriota bacterium]
MTTPRSPFALAAAAALLTAAIAADASSQAPSQASPEPAAPEPSTATSELEVEREIVERGHYRLRGVGSAPVSVDRALQILTAFDQHCAEGCRWPVSSLDHIEVLDAETHGLETPDGDSFTWTGIDDVMDATYFQRAQYREVDGGVELTIEIPEHETLEKLTSDARSHRPFFHTQRVTWRLSPSAGDGVDVDVEMEMLSDSFLINLAPNRVLDGAELSLQELFGHLLTDD